VVESLRRFLAEQFGSFIDEFARKVRGARRADVRSRGPAPPRSYPPGGKGPRWMSVGSSSAW
jgi:hypothetical protein